VLPLDNKPNEWEQSVIDNAVEYSIFEYRSLDRSTKTIVKTYNDAKDLYKNTIKRHRQTLAYAIDKNGRYANLNHLDDFKKEEK
jgi:plastocyanin domain-containing protein